MTRDQLELLFLINKGVPVRMNFICSDGIDENWLWMLERMEGQEIDVVVGDDMKVGTYRHTREHTLLAVRINQEYEELVRQIKAEPVNDTSLMEERLLEAKRTFEVKMAVNTMGYRKVNKALIRLSNKKLTKEKREEANALMRIHLMLWLRDDNPVVRQVTERVLWRAYPYLKEKGLIPNEIIELCEVLP